MFTSSGGMHAQKLFFLVKKRSFYKNIKIHAVDNKNSNKSKKFFHDSFTRVPNSKSKKFINFLKKIVKKRKIDILIPGSDEESIKLCEHKEKFKTFISCPNKQSLKNIKDKYNISKKLKKNKLLNIYFEKINSIENLKKKINEIKFKNFDFVLKPIFSRGGRDVLTIRKQQIKNLLYFNQDREIKIKKSFFYKNEKKFTKRFKKKFPIMIMEKLYEPNLDVDVLAWKGKLIKYVIRKRIGFQASKGSVILNKNLKIEKMIKKLIKIFNLSGIYDCDFMFNKNKNPILLELNPRISGSLYASIYAGANFIDDLISLKKNKNTKITNFKIKNNQKVFSNNILK